MLPSATPAPGASSAGFLTTGSSSARGNVPENSDVSQCGIISHWPYKEGLPVVSRCDVASRQWRRLRIP